MGDVSLLAAFGGGLVSFLSPCVLPIVPGYVGLVSGLSIAEMRDGGVAARARVVRATLLFILGFTAVFVLLGLGATAIGAQLLDHKVGVTRVLGVFVLVMAFYLAGSQLLRAPGMYREVRFHPVVSRLGVGAAPLAGAAFGFGWTPCIGPVLSTVLAVGGRQGDAAEATVLLMTYSAGLGVPFLMVGLALGRLTGPLAWFKRHGFAVTMVSSATLAVFGVLLALDRLWWVTAQLTRALDAVGLGGLVELG